MPGLGLPRRYRVVVLFKVLLKLSPVLELKLLNLRQLPVTRRIGNLVRPVIGRRHGVELRSRWRVTNLPELDFQSEEVDSLLGDVVKPIEGAPVLVGEASGDPYNCDGIQSSRVS